MNFAILAAAAVAASSPASAGTNLHDRSREIAICLAQSSPIAAERILELPRGAVADTTQIAMVARQGGDACLGSNSSDLDPTIVRGGIAETLYKRDFSELPGLKDTSGAAILLQTQTPSARMQYWFAQCLARAAPASTDRLVRSPTGSPAEREMITELAPRWPKCLPSGYQVRLNRSDLRALLAQGLYLAVVSDRDAKACASLSRKEAVEQKMTCPASARRGGVTQIGMDDYPPSSLAAKEAGMSTVQYRIGLDGRVEANSCVVIISSGHARLDQGTCRAIERRMVFHPRLFRGEAVTETRSQTIQWSLPIAITL